MTTPEHPPADGASGVARALGLAVVAGLVGAFVAASLTGAGPHRLVLADPGPLVRWGVPLVSAVSTLALRLPPPSACWGWAAFLAPERTRTRRRVAATRAAATAATGVGACSARGGAHLRRPRRHAADRRLGPARPAGVSFGLGAWRPPDAARARRGRRVVRWPVGAATMAGLAALTVLAVLPLALAGHAAGSANHETAVNTLAVHLVAAVWVGGLLALVVLRPVLGRGPGGERGALLRWPAGASPPSRCPACRAPGSGWGRGRDLGTAYGVLVIVKVGRPASCSASPGWQHRHACSAGLGSDRHPRRVRPAAAVELVVMGVPIGIAVALARSAPPVPDGPWPTPRRPDADRLPRAAGRCGRRLGSRPGGPTGSGSPRGRSPSASTSPGVRAAAPAWRRAGRCCARSSWVARLGWSCVYATSGAPGVYGRVLFSAHMVVHMIVVDGRAAAARARRPGHARAAHARRRAGTARWGPREVLLRGRPLAGPARSLANPIVAAALFFWSAWSSSTTRRCSSWRCARTPGTC